MKLLSFSFRGSEGELKAGCQDLEVSEWRSLKTNLLGGEVIKNPQR